MLEGFNEAQKSLESLFLMEDGDGVWKVYALCLQGRHKERSTGFSFDSASHAADQSSVTFSKFREF